MSARGSSEPLPALYAGWLEDLLGGPIPRESRATCDDCAMCAHAGDAHGPSRQFFSATVKCCSYVPELANFLVGRILSDTDAAAQAGRSTVNDRIAAGLGVTPLGLQQSAVYSQLYRGSDAAFGRSQALRCPHFLEDGGRCGIWRHRESTCATWFCKHVRGRIGYSFWRDAIYHLLKTIERDLARWCVLEIGVSDAMLCRLIETPAWSAQAEPLTADSLDQRGVNEAYRQLWGDWCGRESELFVRCAKLVGPLAWAEVLAICGPEAHAYARLTQHKYAQLMSDAVPATLQAGSFQVVEIGRGVSRLGTYSSYDPIDVPAAVLELLAYFDGRPTSEALAAIQEKRGVRLDASLVRKMVDFELLTPPK